MEREPLSPEGDALSAADSEEIFGWCPARARAALAAGRVTRMSWLLLLSAASATGMAAPAQFAINTQLLDDVVVSPVLTVALSCLVGTVALFASTAILRRSVPELGPIASAPWWM